MESKPEAEQEEQGEVEQTPDDLKEKGNQSVKENNFRQAVKLYSEALRKSILAGGQDLHILFSNRSFAYLKDKKYYYALSDAEKAIELKPDWLKGGCSFNSYEEQE
jgi:tetratricopeptide (TPR) repeat protein